MTTMRVALYVYEKTEIGIDPKQTIELEEMADDYTARPITKIGEPTTLTLPSGVYGFWYEEEHGIKADRSVTVVTDTVIEHKQPWPKPPPPPPDRFLPRRDWDMHRAIFMIPLGSDILMDT